METSELIRVCECQNYRKPANGLVSKATRNMLVELGDNKCSLGVGGSLSANGKLMANVHDIPSL